MKERPAVEVVTDLFKVIDLLVVDLQGVSGAEDLSYREYRAVLAGNEDGSIHTEDGAVHLHNKDGVGPSDSFADAGLVCLVKINVTAVVKITNHN